MAGLSDEQFVHRELVVNLVRIAPRHQFERPFRQAGLEPQDCLGVGGRLWRRGSPSSPSIFWTCSTYCLRSSTDLASSFK